MTMKRYLMSLAALMMVMTASVMTSCSSDEISEIVNPEVVTPEAGTHVETLTIAFPDQAMTRVAVDGEYNLTGWEKGDEVTLVQTELASDDEGDEVFRIVGTYTFTCTDAADGTFIGTLPNGTKVNDCQLAFYNAAGIEVKDDGYLHFYPKYRASQNMKDVVVMVAENDGNENFAMQIFGSILEVTNNTGADITASVKYRWFGNASYYNDACNEEYAGGVNDFYTDLASGEKHAFTLSCTAPTYVYIPVYGLLNGGSTNFSVGLSAEGDAANGCSIVSFKTNPGNAMLYKKTLEPPVAWENALTLGKSEATSIVLEVGVATKPDGAHDLNSEGTLWEVLNGTTLRIQSSQGKIIGSYNPIEVCGLFQGYSKAETITGLDKLATEDMTNMAFMFSECEALTSVDVSSFNTAKVTSMWGMFKQCRSLTSLDLRSFNTTNLTDMYDMFLSCESMTSLDLSSFNTAKVTDMHSLFYHNFVLASLKLSPNFTLGAVTDFGVIFNGTGIHLYPDKGIIYGVTDEAIKTKLRGYFQSNWLDDQDKNTSMKFDGE